jgi:hypothetical protein
MTVKNLYIPALLFMVVGCGDNDPQKENVPEMITQVTLTFTPTNGAPVVVTATDPDGEGVQGVETDGAIQLAKSTDYTLTIKLINGLADPNDEAYDVTHEVESESDEHMFFFAWTGDAFSAPRGNGNIDERNDPVDYSESVDDSGLPLGIVTKWRSADITTQGASFRVMLKHQPGLKSQASKSSDGETDLDVTFDLTVQ